MEKYRKEIEEELDHICGEVIDLLKDHLIPKVEDKKDESEVRWFSTSLGIYVTLPVL